MVIGILTLLDHGERRDTFVSYQIQTMHKAIARFALDTGRCPTQEEGFSVLIAGNYLDHSPIDAWGNEYVYQTDLDLAEAAKEFRILRGKTHGGSSPPLSHLVFN